MHEHLHAGGHVSMHACMGLPKFENHGTCPGPKLPWSTCWGVTLKGGWHGGWANAVSITWPGLVYHRQPVVFPRGFGGLSRMPIRLHWCHPAFVGLPTPICLLGPRQVPTGVLLCIMPHLIDCIAARSRGKVAKYNVCLRSRPGWVEPQLFGEHVVAEPLLQDPTWLKHVETANSWYFRTWENSISPPPKNTARETSCLGNTLSVFSAITFPPKISRCLRKIYRHLNFYSCHFFPTSQ